MLLAIDVGNTNIVVGVFDRERLEADFRLHTDDRMTGDELGLVLVEMLGRRGVTVDAVDAVVVASGRPALAQAIESLTRSYFGCEPLVVGPGVRTGVRIHYDDPRQVGADRIANAIATHHLYGGPAIVVDFGTATTFDVVGPDGAYLGGAIAPGIQISHDALVSNAARLGRVELTPPDSAVGHSTSTSMQSGIVFGYVGLVQGLVARIRREVGEDARVIATGGLADQMAPLIDVIDTVDLRLTLTGLRLIHAQNV